MFVWLFLTNSKQNLNIYWFQSLHIEITNQLSVWKSALKPFYLDNNKTVVSDVARHQLTCSGQRGDQSCSGHDAVPRHWSTLKTPKLKSEQSKNLARNDIEIVEVFSHTTNNLYPVITVGIVFIWVGIFYVCSFNIFVLWRPLLFFIQIFCFLVHSLWVFELNLT